MMYVFNISTPANTAGTAKKETVLRIAHGIVKHVEIQFPPGPAGLLHLHINDALHQIWPYNTDANFASHNVNISFQDFIPVLTAPFEMKAYTWNDDDTFAHTVIIRFVILPVRVAAPWLLSYEEQLISAIGGG